MSLKLYTVEVTSELVLLAESPEEARKEAERIANDCIDRPEYGASTAHEMSYWPFGWDGDAIPHGRRDESDPDRTIDEWIKRGAAPRLQVKP